MQDENGTTRRERTEFYIEEGASSEPPPPLEVPDAGQYIWDWYHALSGRLKRVLDGVVYPIPPSEFVAWCIATGHIIRPSEYDILCAIDVAYCDEMAKEASDYSARQSDARKHR